jgi:hypothetical protein
LDAKVNPKTYIVRVYRFARDNPRRLVGVVEEAGKKGKKAFTGYQELWEILNWPGRSKSKKISLQERGIGKCEQGREKKERRKL